MALTPEQVLNRQFQTTQFRKGYDERDVDDFLDEIVAEMRSLVSQREDFKQQLNDCRAGRGLDPVTESAAGRSAQLGADLEDAEERLREMHLEVERVQDERDRLREALESTQAELERVRSEQARQPATVPDAVPAASEPASAAPAPGAGGMGAAGIIELAQRLYDEHVAKGQARHDELIAEAESRHEELLSTAQTQHDTLLAEAQSERERLLTDARERSNVMLSEAQDKRSSLLAGLEQEQSSLRRKIDELRSFERGYRTELRGLLETKLGELQATSSESSEVERTPT